MSSSPPSSAPLPPWLSDRLPARLREPVRRVVPLLAPGAFVGGFLLDAVTLQRVDDPGDNLQLIGLLALSGALLVLERRGWQGRWTPRVVRRHPGWIRFLLQGLFGGMFSACFIFYSRSASFGHGLLATTLLALLMVANELWFERLRPDLPHFLLWFLSALAYLLFAVPTFSGHLGPGSRIGAAALAAGLTLLLVAVTHAGRRVDPHAPGAPPADGPDLVPALRRTAASVGGLVGLLWVLVLAGAVPPVPLSLAEAGIFHSVERQGDGYLVRYERLPWWAFWRNDDRIFRLREGDTASCYTAVFAPRGTTLRLVHVWEHQTDQGWVETDRLPWRMRGGRGGGWRSWTTKRRLSPGRWRVRVVTEHGQELGRIGFVAVEAAGAPPAELRTRHL